MANTHEITKATPDQPLSPNDAPNGNILGGNVNGNIGGNSNGLNELQQVLVREGLIKEPTSGRSTPEEEETVQPDMVCDDVEAPEGTKLFFSSVRTHRQWKELFQDYERHFGNRINMNGTGHMPDKRVGYINFHTRRDMLEGLEMGKWHPREAYQIPTKADPAPRFAAFAVGFENWRVDAIRELAIALLGATSLNLREVRDEPGVCLGWGIVGFETKEKLEEALEKKKFVLQCRNKATVIALQPYRELADRPKEDHGRHTNPSPNPNPSANANARGGYLKRDKAPEDGFSVRRTTIKSWMQKGILSEELGAQYLQDVDRDEAKARDNIEPTEASFERGIEGLTLNASPSQNRRGPTHTRSNRRDSEERGQGKWRDFGSRHQP